MAIDIELSIVLPTLNEAENLQRLIPEIYFLLVDQVDGIEFIIADDGSTDDTFEIVQELLSQGIPILLHSRKTEVNSLPSSIREGIKLAQGNLVAWLDADGSMRAKVLLQLLEKWRAGSNGSERLVLASRFLVGGGSKGKNVVGPTTLFQAHSNLRNSEDYAFAVFLSLFLNKFLWFAMGRFCTDATSGFAISTRSLLNKYEFAGEYGDYFPRLIYEMFHDGVHIEEIPYVVETRKHGVSKTGTSPYGILCSGIPYLKFIKSLFAKKLHA
jgi:glycosyltransferase involved in cell wall biosynthesis